MIRTFEIPEPNSPDHLALLPSVVTLELPTLRQMADNPEAVVDALGQYLAFRDERNKVSIIQGQRD